MYTELREKCQILKYLYETIIGLYFVTKIMIMFLKKKIKIYNLI